MLPAAVMIGNNVNRTNGPPLANLEATLCRHEFVILPSKGQDIRLAVRNYDYKGVDCYDILVYKQVNGRGSALQKDANSLLQTLSDLQRQLPRNPHHLNPRLQSHTISFLRKRAFVLTNDSQKPVRCQMIPLLLYQSEDTLPAIHERGAVYPIHIIHQGQLEDFLAQKLPKRVQHSNNSNENLSFLKRSFRNLGSLLILIPIAIGLSGILIGLKLIHIAIFTILISILGGVIVFRKATASFHQFQQQNTIPVIQAMLQPTGTPHVTQMEITSNPLFTFEEVFNTPQIVNQSSSENSKGEGT
jgi:hypothetical protein